MNYYKKQLKKIKVNSTQYPELIKVFANVNGEDTHFINLTEETAKVLIEWLQENYINKN